MKIILSVLLFVFSLTSSHAQTVMGIDINTTSKNLVTHFQKLGFSPYQKTRAFLFYKVKFAGYNNIECKVKFDADNDSIEYVNFDFRNYYKDDLLGIYFDLLNQYKAKYPKGNVNNHKWDNYDCMSWHYTLANKLVTIEKPNGTPQKRGLPPSIDVSLTTEHEKTKLAINYKARYNHTDGVATTPSRDI